jgi:glycosyltransferase involved in cell wall biosynthesis
MAMPGSTDEAPVGGSESGVAPLLSIIVPIYNSEATLASCVDSILSQPFRNFELILVDDGSTDGSSALCDQYRRQDRRIRHVRRENGGLSAARNTGLSVAGGSFVSFVDSDDEVYPDFYAAAFDGPLGPDFDLFMVGMDRFRDEWRSGEREPRFLSKDEFHELFLTTNYVGLSACNKIFRRRILSEHELEFRAVRFAEDLVFVSEFASHANRMHFDPRPLYSYKEHPGSMTNKAKTSRRMDDRDFEMLDALDLALPIYERQGDGHALSCFRVRATRSAFRLLILMLLARAYRAEELQRIQAYLREGTRDFMAARHQSFSLKAVVLAVGLLPSSLVTWVLKRRSETASAQQ